MPPLLTMNDISGRGLRAVASPAQLVQRVLRVTRANWQVIDRRAAQAMRQAGVRRVSPQPHG
ncbi:hypothetical protein [Variovorax sp.]|uniref:hypothetical protein n=1 Tax=Variovorax sp. TaxID=1871043 RepID=UPI002D36F7C7|nr:hypothetical protein [Variovorax sp.]HYP82461.1 hypothetical protein [Variovorax sp.]